MATSGASFPESVQVPDREKMHIPAEEKTYRNLRHNPRFMYAHVHRMSDMHHCQRPKAFVYEAKVSVGNALKTPEAHHWVEALNTEIKQLIGTGTLRAVNLADVPADATTINSTMVLLKKPDKYKARLCACGNELKCQIAEIYSPTIGALTYSTVHQIAIIVDTVGAYLYQTYPDTLPPIYIKMPAEVMQACNIPNDIVHRIEKYNYGLPDSGRAYYQAYA